MDNESEANSISHEEPQDTWWDYSACWHWRHTSADQEKGYTMRFRLPKHVLDAAIQEGQMEKRQWVIKYHYGHAVAPHAPSEMLIVL